MLGNGHVLSLPSTSKRVTFNFVSFCYKFYAFNFMNSNQLLFMCIVSIDAGFGKAHL